MLKSMTGYGRSQQTIGERDILVEIKAVNHRYFEFSARVPRAYGYLEEKLKSLLSEQVFRGKVDVTVSIYTLDGADAQVQVNLELARGYTEALRSTMNELELKDDLTLSAIARINDIFLVTKTVENENIVWDCVKSTAICALKNFIEMRENEGTRMLADISARLKEIETLVFHVEVEAPQSVADYKERLMNKMREVLESSAIDEQRLLTEVALFSERIAVDEETVRLRSHLKQLETLLECQEPVGRKLDFLVQEINREVNTIGSKCQSLEVTTTVVEMKGEIEKIREQIQNIE